MRNFISMKDFTKEDILEVLRVAKELENKNEELLSKKIIGSLFFEPSTRTRLSFTSAAYRLGAKVLGFDSPDSSSLKKGETLRDTIKMTEAYSDIIVMRHNRDGAARFASDISKVPVINAGDGSNEHPTQTLLDLYTIEKELGRIENKKIAFVGDLKNGRTVHSLTKALELFNCEFYFIAPEIIQIPQYIIRGMEKKGIKYHISSDYKAVLKEIDVLYMTRIQRERFENIEDYKKVAGTYIIDKESIVGKCKSEMIILHPLPRVDEIKIDLDDTKHAKYFEQAANGVPTRAAIFSIALNLVEVSKSKVKKVDIKESEKIICKNERCITKFEETNNKYIVEKEHMYCYYCNRDITK
ncbi:MAG: aspartate carbamoyltransferase [Cetobacterium sp.]|uniref:aspartate carbamoyltransferase n=1 Tax=Cetobacterium sp. TaxID=2071632 RepID=UPI003F3D3250